MRTFFKELFEYNTLCNQKLIGVLMANQPKAPDSFIKLLSHIINAHQIWNGRIIKTEAVSPWDIQPINELKTLDAENHVKTMEVLDTLELSQLIGYKNTKGHAFSNAVKDILFHVINHSTYHRGQIASICNQNDIEPVVTDYIAYKR